MTAFFSEITRDGEIIDVSSGVEAVAGRPAASLIGRHWTELFRKSPGLDGVLHSRGPWGGSPVRVRLKTGTGGERQAWLLPLWHDAERNALALGTWTSGPATDRLAQVSRAGTLEAEEELELFRAALEHYPATLGLYDSEGRFIYINAEGRRRTGYDLNAVRGRRDEDLFPPELTARYLPALRRALQTGEKTATELRLGGDREILSVSYVPILTGTGEVGGLLGISHDVTAWHEAEEDLQRRNRELSALTRILEIGLGERDMRAAFGAILGEVCGFLGFSLASIQSYREKSGQMVVEAVRGIPDFDGGPFLARADESSCSEIIRKGTPVISETACLSDAWHRRLRFDTTLRARLCVPVRVEKRVVGAMCLAHTEPIPITERMLQWCNSIANYLGMIISRRQTEEALHESELHLARTESVSLVMVAHLDLNGGWRKVPPTLTALLECDGDELLGRQFIDYVHPDDRHGCIMRGRDLLRGRARSVEAEIRMLPKDGRALWIYINSSLVTDEVGRPLYVLAYLRDITAQKRQEDKLRLASRVFESSAEGIMITDARRNIVSVNGAFTELTGYPPEDVLGKNPSVLRSDRHQPEFFRQMWRSLNETGQWEGEIWNRRRDGSVVPNLMTISVVLDERGEVAHYVGMFRDISELKHYQALLEQRANYDVLTGLPNRQLFFDRLTHGLEKARRSGRRLAVLFLDLDNFKEINDTLGHEAGDALLRAVTARLNERTRSEDTVARLGGDEFVVLMEDIEDSDDAAESAQRINGTLTQPFMLADRRLRISGSIGISIFPDDATRADELVKSADTAMYQAKQAGRNRHRFFTREMNIRAENRLTMESELRLALERGEFFLAYQPRVEIASGRTTGFEAMLRWRHPRLGVRNAAEFITVAEEAGLLGPIDRWVLHAVARQLGQWRDAGKPPLPVSVNVSARQLSRGRFADSASKLVAASSLDPNLLELDVKEEALMDGDDLTDRLQQLHRLGVRLSIDDYGAGCSSFSWLKALPVERLKIDQSIIHGLARSDQGLVSDAIIAAGHSMRIKVLAEGVESAEQLGFLREHGCDEAQGYLLGRPVPAAELIWG